MSTVSEISSFPHNTPTTLFRLLSCFFCTAAVVLACAEPVRASTDSIPRTIQGKWEVTSNLVPNNVDRRKANTAIDDVSSIGRVFEFQEEQVVYKGVEIFCSFDAKSITSNVPVKALFADDVAKTKLPPWVTSKLIGQAANYRLGLLATKRATLYRYVCPNENNDPLQGSVNYLGNWFAVVGDTILMPFTNDGLRILNRPAKIKTVAHRTFCSKAESGYEKRVCDEREIWVMHSLVQSIAPCAVDAYPELRPQLAEFAQKRDACEGDRDCVYEALDAIVTTLTTKWTTPEVCALTSSKR
jgi:hypothetical protein